MTDVSFGSSPRGLSFCAVALLTMIAFPPSLEAKCPRDADRVPEVLYMLDGETVSEASFSEVVSETRESGSHDVLGMSIYCRRLPDGRRQDAVLLVTKSGLPRLIGALHAELAEAQERHFARAGAWADALGALEFPSGHEAQGEGLRLWGSDIEVPVELVTRGEGWEAVTHMSEVGRSFRMTVAGPSAGRSSSGRTGPSRKE